MSPPIRAVPATAQDHRLLLDQGYAVNHYQPIVSLRTGEVVGVEVLTRLQQDGRLIPPDEFLGSLTLDDLRRLLFGSMQTGLATLQTLRGSRAELWMAFNLSPRLLTLGGFADQVSAMTQAAGIDPSRLMLEILECNEFFDMAEAHRELHRLRRNGVKVALDDVGTAYSSLSRLRELPVDTIKLDRAFVRGTADRPEDLQFIASIMSLARGLHLSLVVEGVETPEIANALTVLGVDLAQGYAIARPMPFEALKPWLAAFKRLPTARQPNCLLGAYSAHLVIVEACRIIADQNLVLTWPDSIHDPHSCTVGIFLDQAGLHDTALGWAHKRFHKVITSYKHDPLTWEAAAEALRWELEAVVVQCPGRTASISAPGACCAVAVPEPAELRCDAVS